MEFGRRRPTFHRLNLRAMARYRGIAGDPGGVRKFASSLGAVCLTVMLCLKSNGNEICPGSRFKSCARRTRPKIERNGVVVYRSIGNV